MLSRPRSLLFWLVLAVVLYVIATAPVELAHALIAVYRAVHRFLTGLDAFIETVTAPCSAGHPADPV
ncbi:hypothetical protein ACIRD2_06540 [Streptomyces sp. NPDC093595]|uniref:hypothetical protein n=1 Tax=Streptomyces sp. NPDC093595 TaxID=3366045 RepID=UPI0037F8CFA6